MRKKPLLVEAARILRKGMTPQEKHLWFGFLYNGQAFLDRKILQKSVFYRSMSSHAVSPVFPNLEFS